MSLSKRRKIDDLVNISRSASGARDSVSPNAPQAEPLTPGALTGMFIVVTGTLQRFKRTEIEDVIAHYGGKASSSVSSKTTLMLVGESPGSKLDKAKKLGVRIVSEAEFLAMIGQY